jgi:hypothetical protein
MKKSKFLRREILVDELEYLALRRFFELDRKADGAGQAWPVKQVEKWLYEMQILREAIGLLDLRKLPKPEDRGLFNGVRVEV